MENKLDAARNIINAVDTQMAELFLKRMRAVEMVFQHKKEHGLPILDQKREDAVIARNAALIEDETIRGYYIDYLKNLMAISRAYQYRMQSGWKVSISSPSRVLAIMDFPLPEWPRIKHIFVSLN